MKNEDWTHWKIKELRTAESDIKKFKNSDGNETNQSDLEIVEKHWGNGFFHFLHRILLEISINIKITSSL